MEGYRAFVAVRLTDVDDVSTLTSEVVVASAPAVPPKAFLIGLPRGVYTVMRTVTDTTRADADASLSKGIPQLQAHLDRLAEGLRILSPSGSPVVAHLLAPHALARLLLPVICDVLVRFKQDCASSADSDARLTCLAYADPDSPQTCVRIHMMCDELPPEREIVPVAVAAYGAPRSSPTAKDTAWISERAPIEREVISEGVIESLLVDWQTGNIYEGLTTNVALVVTDPDGTPAVITAPSNAVLPGTMMKTVRDCCSSLGITFRDSAFPNIHDMEHCQGAFLTSVFRPIVPISEIRFPHSSRYKTHFY